MNFSDITALIQLIMNIVHFIDWIISKIKKEK